MYFNRQTCEIRKCQVLIENRAWCIYLYEVINNNKYQLSLTKSLIERVRLLIITVFWIYKDFHNNIETVWKWDKSSTINNRARVERVFKNLHTTQRKNNIF